MHQLLPSPTPWGTWMGWAGHPISFRTSAPSARLVSPPMSFGSCCASGQRAGWLQELPKSSDGWALVPAGVGGGKKVGLMGSIWKEVGLSLKTPLTHSAPALVSLWLFRTKQTPSFQILRGHGVTATDVLIPDFGTCLLTPGTALGVRGSAS